MIAKLPPICRDRHWLRALIGRGSALCLLCSLSLTGCSLLARATGTFDDPTIALQTSKVESVSPQTTSLVFTLAVCNPNEFALRPLALHYRLSVNREVVAEGSSGGATVPPKGSVAVDVPIEVRRESLSNAAPAAMVLGEIPYDLEVRMSFDSCLKARAIHFTTSSVLRLNLPLGLANAGTVAFALEDWQS